MNLNYRQLSTVLAALCYFQNDLDLPEIKEMSHFIDCEPLTEKEIAALRQELTGARLASILSENPLLQWRERNELSPRAAAKKLGVSKRRYIGIENGDLKLSETLAKKLQRIIARELKAKGKL